MLRDRRRSAGGRPHGLPRAFAGTAGGTGARARAPAERSRAGTRSTYRHRARYRRPARSVHVRVMRHRRAPGVQDGGDTDARPEVPGIGGDGEQRLGRGLEQDAVDRGRVLLGESAIGAGSVNTTWKYETGNSSAWRSASHCFAAAAWHFGQWRLRQELYATAGGALVAARDMPAEGRRAAALDRRHHLELTETTWPALAGATSGPWATEDITRTPSAGRDTRVVGVPASLSLHCDASSGLMISRIVFGATRV